MLYRTMIASINGPEVDTHQQKPPLADDAKFLDSLLDLDRGLSSRGPVEDHPLRHAVTVPQLDRAEAPQSAAISTVALGSFAARRRPWRASVAASRPEPGLQPPPVGRRARRSSLGDASAPVADLATVTDEQFYGFDEKPFSLSSDLKFVYHSGSFDRATQDLIGAINRRDAVMLLTGQKGAGKTTLCLALLGQLGDSTRTSFLTHPPAEGDDLNVLQQSGVVIVDDAHRWPVEALQQIGRLADDAREERAQIVLVGEPVLLARLGRRALRRLDRGIRTRCRLDPLTADELGGYVAYRMAVAGTGARVQFDESAMTRLHAVSRGVPRVVNLACDRALAEGHRMSASTIDGTLIAAVAHDLDLPASRPATKSVVQTATMLLALIVCMLVGAAAAAWVLRDDLERAIIDWEARPPAPIAPPSSELPPIPATPPAE